MKAVIPAAGLGIRFLPLTKEQPKETDEGAVPDAEPHEEAGARSVRSIGALEANELTS